LPLLSLAQKNKKEKSGFSEKELQAEATFIEGMKQFLAEKYTEAGKFFKKSLEMNPSSGGNFMLSKAYLNADDVPNAAIFAEKALKLDEENKFYRKFLAEIYTKQKRYKDAIEMYKVLSEKNPNDVDSFLDLSNLYIMQEKYSDAVEIYNKIERTIGVSEEITRQKQLIYLRQNKVDKALEEGDRLIASEPTEPDYVVQQAQILISNERLDQAVQMLEKAIKVNADFAQAHVLLAEIYRKQNNLEKCNAELQIAFKNPNFSPEIKFKILSSYMSMLKDDGAEKPLENLISLTKDLIKTAPKESRGYVVLGDLLMKKGEFAAARDNYVKSTNYDKSIFEVWLAIVELDGKLNQTDSLAKHSETAIEYFPNQSFFWYHNGFANYVKKNYAKSIESLEEARNLSVDNQELSKNINALLGDAYNNIKQYAKSDNAYESVLKEDPDNDYVLNNYSYFLSLRKEKLERALELSGKLVAKHKENATYLDTHAWVWYMMKDYAKAREFLELATQQTSRVSGTIIEHLGDVLFQIGEKEKAIEQWKKAKKTGETSPQIDKKILQGVLIE
jgi:tetratricopeptide (TPR) repeat protein